MYKIAAMGDKDSIYGFASIGLDIFPETDPVSAVKTLRTMAESGYAVIYITESLAVQIETEIEKYKSAAVPAIISIPGVTGNNGMGMKSVSRFVEKAVGSDILSD